MFTISEIIEATSGKLIQEGRSTKVTGVSIDSRAIMPSELFVAVKGEKHDGHSFIKQVVKKKVQVILVSKPVKVSPNVTVIRVEDTIKALGYLAAAYRLRFNIPIIAITGSAGKTTTKEILASILSRKFKTLKNDKSFNNHFGVPLTIFKLTKLHQAAVLELGTNRPGDIAWLSSIARPTICILINIGDSHLEELKSRQGVYQEKSQVIKYLHRTGKIIFNQDDEFLKKLSIFKANHECLGFSVNAKSDFQATHISIDESGEIDFRLKGNKLHLPFFGKHLVYNALAAIACSRALKMNFSDIKRGLKAARPANGRQELINVKNCRIINDSYNANPTSLAGALEMLNGFSTSGRRVVICGDMLELGKAAEAKHREIGEKIASLKIDLVLATGKWMRYLVDECKRSKRLVVAKHYPKIENLLGSLEQYDFDQDIILIKGSRSMRMERALEKLKEVV